MRCQGQSLGLKVVVAARAIIAATLHAAALENAALNRTGTGRCALTFREAQHRHARTDHRA
jgi:hypothetical protein